MISLKSQYKNLNQTEINIEWNNAAKYNNFAKVKYMLEADYINITEENINTLIFRVSYNDNLQIFKCLLKHYQVNNKSLTKSHWDIILGGACISSGDNVLKTALKKYKFTPEELANKLDQTIKNIPAFELLASKIDIDKEILKSNFLEQVVSKQCLEMVKLFIDKYQINFTSFKNLALENISKPDADKIYDLINTQELYLKINLAIPDKFSTSIKIKKI